jgi:hypothetical protein
MKRIFIMVPVLALAAGCTGYVATPNGSAEVTTTGAEVYDDTPPVNIETYPRYEYNGGYVYNVNGRYYHRNGNRWMRYNERPRNLDERFERRDHDHDRDVDRDRDHDRDRDRR